MINSKFLKIVFVVGFWAGTGSIFGSSHQSFEKLVDEYFTGYFKLHPTEATSAGLHEHDSEIADHSKSGIRSEVRFLKAVAKKFESINPKVLTPEAQADHELVVQSIKGHLLELEQIRMWEKDPDHYSSGVTESIYAIMSRKFAPSLDRLKSVIARERLALKTLEAGRANLKNPPRIYTEVALEQLPGIIRFFQNDVPNAFADVTDPETRSQFRVANQNMVDALGKYETFLKTDLLPRSNGDFRIGASNFLKKLLYDERVDMPLDRLLQIGDKNLRENQKAFNELAARMDKKRSSREMLAALDHDHPAPEKLLGNIRDMMSGLRQFIVDHKIVSIPSEVGPIIQETPPFMRALTFASMDTPGPFETHAKEAYYNVTLPEPTWSKEKIEDHMAGFNYGTIASTSIHEAYPGHYVQFLWVQHVPSKVRKLIGCSSNAEGWAHYSEQMVLDEGYGNGDPKLRLGQLQDALLRNARFIVGIQMHTGKMSFDEAIEFFIKEGYQSRANAEREVKRGTSDPTYLVYTLGKLQILKLREDYKKMRGDRFTLQEFHDNFLKQGFPPISIVRRALLGEGGSAL